MQPTSILDASALLAYLQGESGAVIVANALIQGSLISAVNWAAAAGTPAYLFLPVLLLAGVVLGVIGPVIEKNDDDAHYCGSTVKLTILRPRII